MGRKSKYIENLSEAEKNSLKKGYSHGKSPLYRRRCHGILLSHSGKSAKELSDLFQVNTQSVREWLLLWEKQGIKGLELKPERGRKPKLDSSQSKHVDTVKTLIKNEPKNLSKVIIQIENILKIEVCKKTLKRFLKNLNTNGNDSENV